VRKTKKALAAAKMIGDNIASRRLGADMTQAALAKKLKVTPVTVGRWERGEQSPDLAYVCDLAKVFGVNWWDILNSTEGKSK